MPEKISNCDLKYIVHDEHAVKFFTHFQDFIPENMSIVDVLMKAGYPRNSVGYKSRIQERIDKIKQGRITLRIFINLAKVLNYDISKSFNYKFYYGIITVEQLRKYIKKFGLTYEQISRCTGYSPEVIELNFVYRKKVQDISLSLMYRVYQCLKAYYSWRKKKLQQKREGSH